MSDVSLKPISPSILKQLKSMNLIEIHETTNENNQFSKWETWIFNAILDQTISIEGYCCESELKLCLQLLETPQTPQLILY